ncbi:MAG: cysteine synthase A [Myxococcales bacterium]|jgi:cysteine synthase A|nr:cysteine synthase A [Myxococcales bacterium]MBL0193008.1 cysteine synthase A [Myxococcales bacterium]HQY62746.1 cysteine synthase A [Polyangiaceae bacterium]
MNLGAKLREGLLGLIGDTPLVRIPSLSRETGCEILGKAEFLNPGGSIKDRTALGLVRGAREGGRLRPGQLIVEGTAGNTGIGLSLVARTLGHPLLIVLPNNQSQEKIDTLRALGAELELVPPAPFASPDNYYHVARRRAEERGGCFADQFESTSNFDAHYGTTAEELLRDTDGRIDGFVASAGTGGSLAGVSAKLAERAPDAQSWLIDCEGSSLYAHVNEGTLDAVGSSIIEGIGIRRITANFARARLRGALRGTDAEMVKMLHFVARRDALFVGGSAALNCVGAVKLARRLGPGKTIVTLLCDGAARYQQRLLNPAWLAERGLSTEAEDLSFVA